jgi:cell wall-associated NlpC family hydrolase
MIRIVLSYVLLSLLFVSCGSTHQPSGIIKVVKDEKTVLSSKKPSEFTQAIVKNSRDNSPSVSEFEIEKKVNQYQLDYTFNEETTDAISNLLRVAHRYKGTRYRVGGMSTSGIDCSGLIVCTFRELDISLPRTSSEQARVGRRLSKGEINKGDLVFFVTRGRSISHVGLVTEVSNGDVKFIHSSTSQGVIVSSLSEDYWAKRFTHASRVL